jgi:hypothetical protein
MFYVHVYILKKPGESGVWKSTHVKELNSIKKNVYKSLQI